MLASFWLHPRLPSSDWEVLAATGQWGWTSCPMQVMAGLQFCATEWQPSLGSERARRGHEVGEEPQKRRGKHSGSMAKRAEPLAPAFLARYRCSWRSGSFQNCSEGRLGKPGVCGSQAV